MTRQPHAAPQADSAEHAMRVLLAGSLLVLLSLSLMLLHFAWVDVPGGVIMEQAHRAVLAGTAPAPIQQRLLPVVIAAAISWTGLPLMLCYLAQRWVATLALLVLVSGSGIWQKYPAGAPLSAAASRAGLLSVLLALSYRHYSFQPGDPLLQVLWGVVVARGMARKWRGVVVLPALGLLIHDLAVLLPLCIGILSLEEGRASAARRAGASLALCGAVAAVLGYALPPSERYAPLWTLSENLAQPSALASAAAYLALGSVPMLLRWRSLPARAKSSLLPVAGVLGAVLCMGLVRELRLLVPVVVHFLVISRYDEAQGGHEHGQDIIAAPHRAGQP